MTPSQARLDAMFRVLRYHGRAEGTELRLPPTALKAVRCLLTALEGPNGSNDIFLTSQGGEDPVIFCYLGPAVFRARVSAGAVSTLDDGVSLVWADTRGAYRAPADGGAIGVLWAAVPIADQFFHATPAGADYTPASSARTEALVGNAFRHLGPCRARVIHPPKASGHERAISLRWREPGVDIEVVYLPKITQPPGGALC